MWYRCTIGQRYRVRIESHSTENKVYWTAHVVLVSSRFPYGRLLGGKLVEVDGWKLWSRICSIVCKNEGRSPVF